jgi:hypothetical protein
MGVRDRRLALAAVFALVIALEASFFGAVAPSKDISHERNVHGLQIQQGNGGDASTDADAFVIVAAVLTVGAGIAFPFFLRTLEDDRVRPRMEGDQGRFALLARSTSELLALLSTSAALIHFAVLREHLREYALFGLLFALTALLQLAWSARVLRRPSRLLLKAGAFGNLGVAAVWLLSRTAGLPLGPDPWTPESVGVADSVATALEVLLVVGVTVLLFPRKTRLSFGPRIAAVGAWVLAAFLVPLTSVALLSSAGAGF